MIRTFLVTEATELGQETFFEGIERMRGGHSGRFDFATNSFHVTRYYEIQRHDDIAAYKVPEATEQFGRLLQDAVRLRLRSDVKVGTCLSGGMDSSTVATLAADLYQQTSDGTFSAITAVSEQESNNEIRFAEMVVKASGLDWHRVKPGYRDFADSLAHVVSAQEEPFGGPSLTMQYVVMKAARDNGITVLLDGQGGDETLLGYEKYYAAYIASTFKREGVGATLAALRASAQNNANIGPVSMAKYLVAGMFAPARYAYYKRRHRHFAFHTPCPPHLNAFARNCLNSFELQKLEIESTNLPILLRYEDKNSMAHSIEARLPFLDYRLVEMSLSLPDAYKIRNGWTKWILRNVMAGRMPGAVVWRKNKFGFEAPEHMWLSKHAPEMERMIASSPILSELTDTLALSRAMKRLDMRSRWRLYSVALWEAQFKVTC